MASENRWEPIPLLYFSPGNLKPSVEGQVTAEPCDSGAEIVAKMRDFGTLHKVIRSHMGLVPLPYFDTRVNLAMGRLARTAEFKIEQHLGWSNSPATLC